MITTGYGLARARKIRPAGHTLITRAVRKTETPTQWAIDMFVDDSYTYSYHEWMSALSELLNDDEFLNKCRESTNAKLHALYMVATKLREELHRGHKDDDTISEITPYILHIARLHFMLQSDASELMDGILHRSIKYKFKANDLWDLTYGWSEV